jgi:hypothetical protein
MFNLAKNTGKGYMIPFKIPLKYKLRVKCPFGIDEESAWKWSAKFLIDMDDDDHYKFLTEMNIVEKEIEKYLKLQFPTTYKEMFVMQSFLPIDDDETHCYFRAKVPVKNGLSSTFFTGNGYMETKRRLTPDDLNHNATVIVEVECDSWWIVNETKSVGYTFIINEMILA